MNKKILIERIKIIYYTYGLNLKSFKVIAFDELKNDQKNPIDQCKTLNPVNIFFFLKYYQILSPSFRSILVNPT
jgi:hypothetical protein